MLNNKWTISVPAFILLSNVVIGILLVAADLRVLLFLKRIEWNSSSCKLKSFFFRPERYLRFETSIGTNLEGELDKAVDQSLPTVCLSISEFIWNLFYCTTIQDTIFGYFQQCLQHCITFIICQFVLFRCLFNISTILCFC